MEIDEGKWQQILHAVDDGSFVFPEKIANTAYNPWNSQKSELAKIGTFIRLFQPGIVVELGTFEALGTEFILNEMLKYGKRGITKLYTVDVPFVPYFIEETVSYSETTLPDFEIILEARKERLNKLQSLSDLVEVIYVEKISYEAAAFVAQKETNIDFIFHDSTHLASAMRRDINAFGYLPKGTVICLDNVLIGHCFFNYFPSEFTEWKTFHTNEGSGQLWMIKER